MTYTSAVAVSAAAPPVVPSGSGHVRLAGATNYLRKTWSTTAAFRALRMTIVMPSLFALSLEVFHNAANGHVRLLWQLRHVAVCRVRWEPGGQGDRPRRVGRRRERADRHRDLGQFPRRSGSCRHGAGGVLRPICRDRRA